VMDVTAAEDVFTQRGLVNRIDVVVGRQATTDAVRAAIEAILPQGLGVTTPAQRKLDLQNVMRSFGELLRGIGLVGMIIAYLIAFSKNAPARNLHTSRHGILRNMLDSCLKPQRSGRSSCNSSEKPRQSKTSQCPVGNANRAFRWQGPLNGGFPMLGCSAQTASRTISTIRRASRKSRRGTPTGGSEDEFDE
jgi:hypothetical protein